MRRYALPMLALLSGCSCGSYEIANTLTVDAEGNGYNGSWFEECGATSGTSGTWNHFGDGRAWITFWPTARGSRSWQGLDIVIQASLPTELLVPGTVLDAAEIELAGDAYLNPGYTMQEDYAWLDSGTLEVLSGWEGDDVCAEEDGPTFSMAWSLVFSGGEGDAQQHRVEGRDKVQFSTWLSEECGSW